MTGDLFPTLICLHFMHSCNSSLCANELSCSTSSGELLNETNDFCSQYEFCCLELQYICVCAVTKILVVTQNWRLWLLLLFFVYKTRQTFLSYLSTVFIGEGAGGQVKQIDTTLKLFLVRLQSTFVVSDPLVVRTEGSTQLTRRPVTGRIPEALPSSEMF